MDGVHSPLNQSPRRNLVLAAKRLADLACAFILLLVLLPVLGFLAMLILIDSGMPIIYGSQRYGRGGSIFRMYKFRTMVIDADERLTEVQHLNIADGNQIKIPDDPRRTPLGRVLSRTSLDELLNLINVLRGEMSLIGPRPHTVQEYPEVTSDLLARLTMRPGITGLWQVQARNHPAEAVRAECDRQYVATWSFWLDMQIAIRTIPAVLRFRGGEPDPEYLPLTAGPATVLPVSPDSELS